MERKDDYYLLLADKWLKGTISPEERQEYFNWLNTVDPSFELEIPAYIANSATEHRNKIYQIIQQRVQREKSNRWRKPLMAAATLAIVIGLMVFLSVRNTDSLHDDVVLTAPTDIEAGMTGAILTLANGRTIVIDTASSGSLDSAVVKNAEILVFEEANEAEGYNSLATPRARQQQLVLPDGSSVWLNAESSIRFPASFRSARTVSVTGEVYFEVAPDKMRPFEVRAANNTITVLGTHFNVMAYPNESSVETTLLEGAVKVVVNDKITFLKPGQQAQSRSSGVALLQQVDTEAVMAWRNGLQAFRTADMGLLLRQISRWYDVDIVENGTPPVDMTFSGEIPRSVTLSQLLKVLESSGIVFRIDAPSRKLFVNYSSQ